MRFLLPALIFLSLLESSEGGANPQSIGLRSGPDTIKAYCCRPEGTGPFAGLVIVHGDFGLTPWVKKQAQRLAGKGCTALAVDLYRGELPKDTEEAHILERALPEDRVLRDLKAAVDYLAARSDVRKDRLGVIGWEMGGGYALDAAMHDSRLRAVVNCYGRLTTDAKSLRRLNASVLGIFAEKDEGISADTRKRFEAAMKTAGKRLAGLHLATGADNGFMDPNSPYREGPVPTSAIADAWQRIDAYLAAELIPSKRFQLR